MKWLAPNDNRSIKTRPLSARRRVLGLIAAGIILVTGANLALMGEPESTAPNPGRSGSVTNFFTATDIETLDRIVVTSPAGLVVDLRRSGPNWLIVDGERTIPISHDRAARLLATSSGAAELRGDMFASLKAENPANHDLVFGVSLSKATHVQFYRGEDCVEDLLIGRVTPQESGVGTFIRRPEENAVYLVEGNLRDNFAASSLADWREQKPLSKIRSDEVESILVTSADGTSGYDLRRNDVGWRVSWAGGDAIADPTLAAGAVREISSLRFIDFDTPAESLKPTGAKEWNIRVRTTSGENFDFNLWSAVEERGSSCFAALTHAALGGRVFFPYALLRDPAEFTVESATARVAAGGAASTTSTNG